MLIQRARDDEGALLLLGDLQKIAAGIVEHCRDYGAEVRRRLYKSYTVLHERLIGRVHVSHRACAGLRGHGGDHAMRGMYTDRRKHMVIVAGAVLVFGVALWLVRSQNIVGDVA